jgi:nucleoside-diphosphate-sugar epimerase
MKIFLTGATGYIGSAVTDKLLEKGHQVVGLARSSTAGNELKIKGADVVLGDLDDAALLSDIAGKVDGVIHAGFKQSKNGFLASMINERKSVAALLDSIKNTGKPFVYTSGTGMLGDTGTIVYDEKVLSRFVKGRHTVDDNGEVDQAAAERMKTESDVLGATGVRGIVLRSPNVYGRSNGQALITHIIKASKKISAVPYANFSSNHLWSFVHVDDLADLYVLALEKSGPGELFYAGAEKGLKTKYLAEALSIGLGYKGKTAELDIDELTRLFEQPLMADFWTWNNQSSGAKAERILGWKPKHINMLKEIEGPEE